MSRPGPTFPKGVVLAPHPLSEGWSEARLFWLPEPDSPFNSRKGRNAAWRDANLIPKARG